MAWIFRGSSVRAIRESMGMTAERFARLCGLSRQTILETELEMKGRKPNVKLLEKIMEQFPIDPTFFFKRTNHRKKANGPQSE